MTENFIIVEKVQEADLESILMDLANLYADTEYVNGIQLYRKKDRYDSFLIGFTNQPDFARFNYFVNYLRFPVENENFSPFIRGYYQMDDVKQAADFNAGERLMVYIPQNPEEFDNVHFVNPQNENYVYDFGGAITKLTTIEETYQLISLDKNLYHHVIDVFPSKRFKNDARKPLIGEKFKDVLALIVSLAFTVVGYYALEDARDVGILTLSIFGFGSIILLWKLIRPNMFEKSKSRKNKQ